MTYEEWKKANELIDMAFEFRRRGDSGEAIGTYTKLIGLHPKAEFFNQRGVILLDLGQASLAESDFTEAIDRQPSDPDYYANRGNARLLMEHYQLALADFDVALSYNAGMLQALNGRGATFLELGMTNEAQSDFELALQLKRDYVPVLCNYAKLAFRMGDLMKAHRLIERAFETEPKNLIVIRLRERIVPLQSDPCRDAESRSDDEPPAQS